MPFHFRPELLSSVVERLRALADESRLRILMRLREGDCNVGTLAEELDIPQASVSKHLAVLRQAGIVDVAREGTLAIHRVKDDSVFEMCEIVCGGVVRHLRERRDSLAMVLGKAAPPSRRTRKNEK